MRLEDINGQRLGRYEMVALLGRGGMAAVYRARDTLLRRELALKIIYPQYSADSTLHERFQREAVLAARLEHPHIVPIYDVGEQDQFSYIAMKLVDGRPLSNLLVIRRTLPPVELIPILAQIGSALDYAHARGVVHRDIKPGNILLEGLQGERVGPETHAMLTDFGIAKSLDAPSLTGTGAMLGTPDYMAPEQIRGDKNFDARLDVYAIGVLAYRCLTGRQPFEGTLQEVLIGHIEGRFSSPSALNPMLPTALDPVIRQAMAMRPADRYPSVGTFVLALAAVFGLQDLARSAPLGMPLAAVSPAISPAAANANTPTLKNPQVITQPLEQPKKQPIALANYASQTQTNRWFRPVLVVLGLLLFLGAGLLIGRLSAAANGEPTAIVQQPSALPSATPNPSNMPTPSDMPTLSPTLLPPTNTSALPLPATNLPGSTATEPPIHPEPTSTPRPPTHTATNTAIPATATLLPTNLPPTIMPTIIPTATNIPTEVATTQLPTEIATDTATATLTPTLTPGSTVTPSPTACPITAVGGFGLLLQQQNLVQTRMGCPAEQEQGGSSALVEQPFQSGSMIYFAPNEEIYVLIGSINGIWYRFEQASLAGKPTPTPAPDPGSGLLIPIRGFGLVWGLNAEIRNQIGYATAPEAGPLEGASQRFAGGTMLYSATGLGRGKTIYVLYADGTFERYADPNQ